MQLTILELALRRAVLAAPHTGGLVITLHALVKSKREDI